MCSSWPAPQGAIHWADHDQLDDYNLSPQVLSTGLPLTEPMPSPWHQARSTAPDLIDKLEAQQLEDLTEYAQFAVRCLALGSLHKVRTSWVSMSLGPATCSSLDNLWEVVKYLSEALISPLPGTACPSSPTLSPLPPSSQLQTEARPRSVEKAENRHTDNLRSPVAVHVIAAPRYRCLENRHIVFKCLVCVRCCKIALFKCSNVICGFHLSKSWQKNACDREGKMPVNMMTANYPFGWLREVVSPW